MTSVSLAMITLNSGKSIRDCLLSIKDYVDEICILDGGSTDNTLAVVKEVCPDAKIETYIDPNRHPEKGWTSDFAEARNRSFAMCGKDAILWIDADDVVVSARTLRAAINDFFVGKGVTTPVTSLSLLYVYARDAHGHPTVVLPRVRVVKRGAFAWHGPVHEDLHPTEPAIQVQIDNMDATFIDHRHGHAKSETSAERNLWIMQGYMGRGGEMNDRLWQNVGTALLLLGRKEESLEAFARSLAVPHNNDECDFITHMRMGDANVKLGRMEDAMAAFSKASILFPDRRAPHLGVAEILVGQGRAKEALHFVDIAERANGDSKGFAWNPTTDTFVPAMCRARALTILEDYVGALAQYEKLSKEYPEEKEVTGPRDLLRQAIANHALYESFMAVHRSLEHSPDQQRALINMAPPALRTFPAIAKATLPDRPDGKPSLAIYCGKSHRTWGYDSVETGVGGSEEAVILLSRELASQGWHVEVYAFPGPDHMGTDPYGVVWAPYYAWDESRYVDVYIGWRQYRNPPQANARVKALWLHDTVWKEYFTDEMVAQWDVIFALSKHHAEALPDAAKAKLVLTANGLNPDFFVKGKNHKHAFIYASSPDRGLLPLLRQWRTIKEALPGATLDVFYGFTQHFMVEASRDAGLRKLKAEVDTLLTQPGVYMHGMVGQRELAHAFARSGFWLYPTAWSETSCITAMKAQALGAIPITSRYPLSAIPETAKFDLGPAARSGSIYDDAGWLAEWTETVIREADRDHTDLRKAMQAWAREEFSWSKIAAQWSALFSERLQPVPVPALSAKC